MADPKASLEVPREEREVGEEREGDDEDADTEDGDGDRARDGGDQGDGTPKASARGTRKRGDTSLGTRLNIMVVPVRTFQMRIVLVRNIFYSNTTGTSWRDRITMSVAISSEVCK